MAAAAAAAAAQSPKKRSSPAPLKQFLQCLQSKLRMSPLKMTCGSHCIAKESNKLGEDAHFICEAQQVVGVADGVGGWAKKGIDAGEFARELMSNAARSTRATLKSCPVDPSAVLKDAYMKTKSMGSSTACVVALRGRCIHAANIGDSGFVVIRRGAVVYHSPKQLHAMDVPYQLGSSGKEDDPSSALVLRFGVKAGDVIVVGTDGLFDNMFNHTLETMAEYGVKMGLDPKAMAISMAAQAHKFSRSESQETPFSIEPQDPRRPRPSSGGKRDDITVVVMYVH